MDATTLVPSLRRPVLCALVFALVVEAGAVRGTAQGLPPGHVDFRTYGVAQGLSNLAIQRVEQDSSGFLWVATEGGLHRYDGQRFTHFGVEDGLPSSWITTLLATAGGELWVGTQLGLAYKTGVRFVTVPGAEVPLTGVSGLALDGQGDLLVASLVGFFRRSPGGLFGRVPGWPLGEATAVAFDATSGAIYVAGGSLIGRLDARSLWTFWKTGLDSERIDALLADPHGTVWAASPKHLFSQGPGELRFRDHTAEIGARSSAYARTVLALDRRGALWLPTDAGLVHLEDGHWTKTGSARGLPVDMTNGALHDREGNLWSWQAGLGLFRALGRGLWESWSQKQGLPSDGIWSIVRDHSGELWIGMQNGLAHAKGGRWVTVRGTEGFAVRAIGQTRDGRLWLGTVPSGALLFDPRTERITAFREAGGVKALKVMDLMVDHADDVWLATIGGGLLHRSHAGGRFERLPAPLVNDTSAFVFEDSQQRIWTGGPGGLSVWDGTSWRRFTAQDGLRSDAVLHLTESAAGDLWVSYFEPVGITRFRLEGNRFQVLEHRDAKTGLAAAQTYFLKPDKRGRLWVGTGAGIDVIDGSGVRHFDTSDGVAGDDCDFNAFWADQNGDVFVGTSTGLSRFRGSHDQGALGPPATAILAASVGGKPLAIAQSQAAFPHAASTLEVRFSSMTFVDESQVEQQVRLEGLEPDWVDVSAGRTHYPALSPGRYVFEARSRVKPGAWGAPSRLAFRILPAWWESWPVRLVEGLFAAAFLFGLVWLRIRRLERSRARLEVIVAERTAQLARANEELGRLSRVDGLTGLANRRAFDEWLEREGKRAAREGTEVAVILLDVDYFKLFNDTYGHQAGDECLRRVGEVLSAAVRRPTDLAARYGGEEFAVILPGSSYAAAERIAESIRAAIEGLGISHSASKASRVVTSSLGLACGEPGGGDTFEGLLSAADQALYRAKGGGRNRVVGGPIAAFGAAA